jgi:hypothetical protein
MNWKLVTKVPRSLHYPSKPFGGGEAKNRVYALPPFRCTLWVLCVGVSTTRHKESNLKKIIAQALPDSHYGGCYY